MAIKERMRQALQMSIKLGAQAENQTVTGDSGPVIAEIAYRCLEHIDQQHHDAQHRELALGGRTEADSMPQPGSPAVDNQVDPIGRRLRRQQHVNDVLECKRERERQRKLADAHQRREHHEPQLRPYAGKEADERLLTKAYWYWVHE